ncbi:GIY-YIG nuclease family protein [Candidatus Kaiserbacteria bacterium]|nr:GIY-YIG nuclease family protein [Candidatus Kaiserbacteria bacterium]
MFTVYILRDDRGKIYKGMTSDLPKRLIGHKSGNTRSTRGMKNMVVVYQKIFETSDEARRHEKYLKSAAGRRFLKTRLQSNNMRP